VLPAKDSVYRHQQFHFEYPKASILAGNPAEYASTEKKDFQNYRAYLNTVWMAPYKKGISQLTFDNFFLSAANFSIKKEAFLQLSGFNPLLKDHEDYDMAYRALLNSHEVWFDSDNIAIHNDPITCASYIKRLNEYRKAENKLSSLYPKATRATAGKQHIHPIKKMIYWIFSCRIWVDAIDNFKLFKLLPKMWRYKMYDIIVFSQSKVFPRENG
jgi:GT2 family glycosyltransferase